MRFQYCMNSSDFLLYIRAIQGHIGGNLIAPELMGHVAIPHKWKEFLYHRGWPFNATMVLEIEPQHAENTHFFVQIQIPDVLQ